MECRLFAYADAVVPESNIIFLPLIAHMDLLCSRDDFIEIADNGIALSLWNTNNTSHKTRIEEQ